VHVDDEVETTCVNHHVFEATLHPQRDG